MHGYGSARFGDSFPFYDMGTESYRFVRSRIIETLCTEAENIISSQVKREDYLIHVKWSLCI